MHHLSGRSDLQLLESSRKGDRSAFEALYRRYEARVYAYVLRMVRDEALAADLRQEVFLRLWENLGRASRHRSLPAYLLRVARNLAIDQGRHDSVRRRWDEYARSAPLATSPPADVVLERKRRADAVNAAVEDLPERMREVFVLKRDGGLSYAEISELLGIAPKTVERHVANALQRLREALRTLRSEAPDSRTSSGA